MTPDLSAIRQDIIKVEAAQSVYEQTGRDHGHAILDRVTLLIYVKTLLAEVDRLMKEAEEHHLQDIADWQDYNATEDEA